MNKSDIIKAAELSYEERVGKAALALCNYDRKDVFVNMFEHISQSDNDERYIESAQAALKAAGIDQLQAAAALLKQVEATMGAYEQLEDNIAPGFTIAQFKATQEATKHWREMLQGKIKPIPENIQRDGRPVLTVGLI